MRVCDLNYKMAVLNRNAAGDSNTPAPKGKPPGAGSVNDKRSRIYRRERRTWIIGDAKSRDGGLSFKWTTFEQLNKLSLTWRVLLQGGDDRLIAGLLGPRMRCCPHLRVRFDWVGSPLQH